MEKNDKQFWVQPDGTKIPVETTGNKSASVPCYNADGARVHEEAGWCNYTGKCKSKHRVFEKGPCGGLKRTDSFMCQEAL